MTIDVGFVYSNGSLETNSGGTWIDGLGEVHIYSNVAFCGEVTTLTTPSSLPLAMAYYDDVEWNNDQTVDITHASVDEPGGNKFAAGPAARCGANSGYLFMSRATYTPSLYRVDSATDWELLGTGTTNVLVDEVVRIVVSGYSPHVTINCYQGGELEIGPIEDDSANRIESGKAGICFQIKDYTPTVEATIDSFYSESDVAVSTEVGDSRKTYFVFGGGFQYERLVNTW